MNVVRRISSLSSTGKIVLALIAALGAIAAIALGYHYGAGAAAGGIFMVIGSMFAALRGRKVKNDDFATKLVKGEERAARRDADRIRDESESRSRDNAQARSDAAVEAARHAGDDDGGNPNSVFERHRRDYTGDD